MKHFNSKPVKGALAERVTMADVENALVRVNTARGIPSMNATGALNMRIDRKAIVQVQGAQGAALPVFASDSIHHLYAFVLGVELGLTFKEQEA